MTLRKPNGTNRIGAKVTPRFPVGTRLQLVGANGTDLVPAPRTRTVQYVDLLRSRYYWTGEVVGREMWSHVEWVDANYISAIAPDYKRQQFNPLNSTWRTS
jgi:hypothetical protein